METGIKIILDKLGFVESEVTTFEYTSFQAVEDGIFYDIKMIPYINQDACPFRFITTNLLRQHGYLTEKPDEQGSELLNILATLDLIIACNNQCSEQSKEDPTSTFFVCDIESPKGEKFKAWVNYSDIPHKFTIMNPDDY